MKMNLIRLWILILTLTSLTFSIESKAWNAVGHMVIAKIAYDRLNPAVRLKVDKIVADFSKEYPEITRFEQLAPWPDTLRAQKIDIFAHWHYKDVAFSDDGTRLRDLIDTDNAVWAFNHLKPVVQNNHANPFERARFLAFMIHIAGDIHQPLHTVSRISSVHLDGDRGGNLFQIKYKIGTTDISNLHHLWDGGAGVLETNTNPSNIAQLALQITTHYPVIYFTSELSELSADAWAKEGYKFATESVYNTKENETPTNSYIKQSQQITEQRVALAGYRLAEILNALLA